MTHKSTKYDCDNCGKELPTCRNTMDIMTSKREDRSWARLHVKVEFRHGIHNDAKIADADLCRDCAIHLLTDALDRVRGGERATAGTEAVEMRKR